MGWGRLTAAHTALASSHPGWPHFKAKETETLWGEVTFPRSHSSLDGFEFALPLHGLQRGPAGTPTRNGHLLLVLLVLEPRPLLFWFCVLRWEHAHGFWWRGVACSLTEMGTS